MQLPPRTLLALPAVLVLAAIAAAGTAVRMSVRQLLDGSELCIEGRVLSAAPLRQPGGRIDTEYTIQVSDTLWGAPEAVRSVRLPGGVLPDGSGMIVPGIPALGVGEEVLLFLSRPDPTGMRVPVGLSQGRFGVVRDREGRKRLVRELRGTTFAGRPGPEVPTELPYEATLAEIRAAAALRRGRERSNPKGDER